MILDNFTPGYTHYGTPFESMPTIGHHTPGFTHYGLNNSRGHLSVGKEVVSRAPLYHGQTTETSELSEQSPIITNNSIQEFALEQGMQALFQTDSAQVTLDQLAEAQYPTI